MTRRRLAVVVRVRRARSALARFLGGSAAIHGLLLVGIVVVPLTRRRAMPVEPAMVVALAGPIGGGATAARPAAAAPAPPSAPAPAPKEAHAVREVPVPKPKEKPEIVKKKEPPKPEVKKPESHEAAPGPENAAPKTSESRSGTAAPAAGPAPGPGTATGVTASIGGGDSALGWYGAAVKAALESAWAKPYLEGQGQVYSVVVAFEIARDGTARDPRIVEPSGVPSLDRSAIRAVMEASPLPALPPAWTEPVLPVTMRFNFNPESNGP